MKKILHISIALFIIGVFPGCNNPTGSLSDLPEVMFRDSLITFQHDWEKVAGGALNLSFQLDKPAGKDGFPELKGGHFYTPSGERLRIWGVNLTGGACYPEKEDAPKVAELLAALGINAVRFHFLDSDWGDQSTIFSPDASTTQKFNPEQLDKLDYFVSELKKQGIYSNFNLNVGRNFREGDNVPFHRFLGLAKAVTLFDDRIIELQKKYAYKLLTHENRYTGNQYRNEPALAFVEIVNENSLVEAWFRGHLEGTHNSTRTSTWIDIPEYYANELTEKYNRWLEENLAENDLENLRSLPGLKPGDPVPRLKNDEFSNASDLRFYSEARFIMETENAFYSGMYRFLKDSVKAKQWVAANSDHNHWKSGYALLSSASKLDFVDGHVYWQHPRYFRDKETGRQTFSIDNTPMVNDPWFSTVAQLSRSAVAGKPYTVSETNHPFPNEYACEGIPILAVYALLQDWDGIYFYTFEHADPSEWKTKTPGYFDIMHDPVKLGNLASASLMFHRGDIGAAQTTVLRNYTEKQVIEGIREGGDNRPFFTPGLDPFTPLVYKTRINSFSEGENDFPEIIAEDQVRSETGELQWHYGNDRGLVVINTPKTQGLVGYSEKMNEVSTENIEVNILNPFASVFLTSIDGNDLERSGKMLLTFTAGSTLTGSEWNAERTTLEEWGTLPFMIEPVAGTITLKGVKRAGSLKVTPLDPNGYLRESLPVVRLGRDKAVFSAGGVPAIWYLIEK
ncbi:MAG: hypothetical protein K9J30_04630 [Bacteroidales bacterium]|nr:hypothetical protein [Bacteroidales bacterium]